MSDANKLAKNFDLQLAQVAIRRSTITRTTEVHTDIVLIQQQHLIIEERALFSRKAAFQRKGRKQLRKVVSNVTQKVSQQTTRHAIPAEVIDILSNQSTFVAARLTHFLSAWQELTCDHTIMQWVTGVKIEFINNSSPTCENIYHQQSSTYSADAMIVRTEIQK